MSSPFDEIIALLDDNKVEYKVDTHEKAITSMDVVKLLNGFDIRHGAKSILFKLKNEFKLVVVRGDNRADYAKVRKHFGSSKIRLATPDEVHSIMRVTVGACYPFGSVAGVDMIVDATLAESETIHFSPGTHYDHISMKFAEYQKIVKPVLVDIAQ